MGDSDKIAVSFACQRCLQPIVLEGNLLDNINEHAAAELALPTRGGKVNTIDTQDEHSYDHLLQPYRITDSNGTGFMVVTGGRQNKKLSSAFKLKAELFDCLSSNSEIDHPLCEECGDSMLEIMDRELKVAMEEWNDYKSYLKQLEQNPENPNIEELEKELSDLKEREQKLLSELGSLKVEEQELDESIQKEEEKKQELLAQEASYWREYTKHRRELMLTEDNKRSLEAQIAYAQDCLQKSKDTNIYNITFHIWHFDRHFGTINNFRLGRLPSASVDWWEINAAWGQTALLLDALARKIELTFENYRIVPFGNHSYVEVLGEHRELPLYGTGGFKFMWDTKFDAAMVAFLDCLTQFQQEVEKRDPEFSLPYKMEKGKIIDATQNSYSIKIQFNSEEQWTKALKLMLTNLKWGLAWVSAQFVNQ